MRKRIIVSLSIIAGLTTVTAATLLAQRGPRDGGGASLSEPFRGITTDGKIEEGLFKIKSTGVTTKPVVDAAQAFLDGLSDEQKNRTVFPVDDAEWRQWDNRHMSKRQGVGFNEMDEAQRKLAFDLMGKSLSAKGLKLSQDIMKLNGTLAELANNYREYGEWLYWITIMGKPSETEPWGWQIDGHHLVVNYFVLGDQVVMSPVFIGSEPVHATSGKFAGTIIMQDEQNAGLAFMQSLSEAQQKEATISSTKPGNNNLTEAHKDNVNVDVAGLSASKLDEKHRSAFLELIGHYVNNMREGHAKVKMSEVEAHLGKTYFAWAGGTKEDSAFYYRIHSPVVLIEFDHQRRVAPFRSGEPSRDHIHAVIRTPNGNDYGKDLLRQHLEKHHSKASASGR
jgi:Protein of unknown function (DUF3500)